MLTVIPDRQTPYINVGGRTVGSKNGQWGAAVKFQDEMYLWRMERELIPYKDQDLRFLRAKDPAVTTDV
jgi:hypothetical protein